MTVGNAMYWDPVAVLDIDPSTQAGVLCQGVTLKGKLCCNLVAMEGGRENLRPFIRLVGGIPMDKVTAADLKPMAPWVLCKRDHRGKSAQVNTIVHRWCTKLEHVAATRASKQKTTRDSQALKRQVSEAQIPEGSEDHATKNIQSVCVKLQHQLWESQRWLVEQEAECKKSQARNDRLEGDNKILEARNSEIAKLKDLLEEESHRKAETYRERLEAIEAEKVNLQEEIKRIRIKAIFRSKRRCGESDKLRSSLKEERREKSRLRAEVQQITESLNREAAENKRLTQDLHNREAYHESQLADIRRQLVEKDAVFEKWSRLVSYMKMKLQQQEQSATTEIEHVKAEHHRVRVRSHVQALRNHVIFSIKQRKYDEARADNEALLQQHKHLQQAMSEIASELHTAEVRHAKRIRLFRFTWRKTLAELIVRTEPHLTIEDEKRQKWCMHCTLYPTFQSASTQAFGKESSITRPTFSRFACPHGVITAIIFRFNGSPSGTVRQS